MMKDKMFVVPGSFVPYNDTVTLLTYKRLRNLDLDIDVFAFKAKQDQSLYKQLKKDKCFGKFNITYTSELDYAIPRNNPLRLPIGLVLMTKYVFDSLKQFEKKEYKYLFTSIVPGICHICGKRIKKKHPEVIWYASFSDPFKNSPYKNVDLSGKNIFYKIAYKVGAFFLYNNKYEEAAIRYADKLIFICEEQRDYTISQYQDLDKQKLIDKSIIMPLTYIKDWDMYADLLESKHKSNTPKVAVHLGRLYGLRKIDTFLQALAELKNEDKDLNKKIIFHQYSEIQPEDVLKIKELDLQDLFILHDKVSYHDSIEVMKNADVLVLFDTLMPNSKIQPYLPSKIVEYLLLNKPILGICGNNSPSYRILKEYGFETIGYSIEDIKKNVLDIISNTKEIVINRERLENDHYSYINYLKI